MATNTPTVSWAQRAEQVFVTIDVKDCKEPTIELEEKSLKFKGESAGKTYAFDMEFYADLVKDECKINKKRVIELVLKKKEAGSWPSLGNKKLNFVKIDWNKWADSDDEGEDFDTDGMQGMGGMPGGMGGMPGGMGGMPGGMGGMGGMPGMGGMGGMPGMGGMDFSQMMAGMGGGMGGGAGGMPDMSSLMSQMGGMGGMGGGEGDSDDDEDDLPDLDGPVGGEDGEGEKPAEKPVVEVETASPAVSGA